MNRDSLVSNVARYGFVYSASRVHRDVIVPLIAKSSLEHLQFSL